MFFASSTKIFPIKFFVDLALKEEKETKYFIQQEKKEEKETLPALWGKERQCPSPCSCI